MQENPGLETYWIVLSSDAMRGPGIGVTARSRQDAFDLVRAQGLQAWIDDACVLGIVEGVRLADLDPGHVAPNIGPMQFRGVWFPVANIGWGAPEDAEFRRLGEDRD